MNGAVKPVSVLPVNVFACALLDSPLFVVAYSQLRTRLLERERERLPSTAWDGPIGTLFFQKCILMSLIIGRICQVVYIL